MGKTFDNPDTVRRLVLDAMSRGGTRDYQNFEVDYAEYCDQPVRVYFEGPTTRELFPSRVEAIRGRKGVTAKVPCRKCWPCRKIKAFNWTQRCLTETAHAGRTWFVTLTYKNSEIQRLLMQAAIRYDAHGSDYDSLSESARFGAMVREAGKDVTKWLKRVRHHAGVKSLRYFLVCEKHGGHGPHHGYPHWHLLVHEPTVFQSLSERLLRRQWREHHGVAQAVLVRPHELYDAVTYLAKYVTKSPMTRCRGSIGYGDPASAGVHSALSQLIEIGNFEKRTPVPPTKKAIGGGAGDERPPQQPEGLSAFMDRSGDEW